MERTLRTRGNANFVILLVIGLLTLIAVIGLWILLSDGDEISLTAPVPLTDPIRAGITQHRLTILETALLAFSRDVGRFPTEAEGLKALVAAPDGVTDYPETGYIEPLMLKDGWANAFVYRMPADTGIPVVISGGADGRIDGTGPPADLWIHPAIADIDVNILDPNRPIPETI